ncbi:hypothetical protein RM190_09115 [Paracoccus sp. CPCC 101403]|uniref:Uncharacterized protein n=2 Tax=Paracoccus broussonetiae TaxID=3075834 RepID=A0ABU3ECQ2_9RHOB|nr:hypothetical protein [Paracoccus sp. CPCC 101403]MDT1062014.1 hypothetical protein [Paracoccus sp. CPCC 101403]
MSARQGSIRNFVLVYSEAGDPTREETAEVLDHLKSVKAQEVIPGTIKVTGRQSEVEKCLDGLNQWELSSEKILAFDPPHKSQLR